MLFHRVSQLKGRWKQMYTNGQVGAPILTALGGGKLGFPISDSTEMSKWR